MRMLNHYIIKIAVYVILYMIVFAPLAILNISASWAIALMITMLLYKTIMKNFI